MTSILISRFWNSISRIEMQKGNSKQLPIKISQCINFTVKSQDFSPFYSFITLSLYQSLLIIKIFKYLTAPMHRSINSTEALSKTFSRIKMGESSVRQGSPVTRPLSSRSKFNNDYILQENLIMKNKKLSMMIRTVHSYMTYIEQLDWIMKETQKIMKGYMRQACEKAGVAHKIQIENLYNQLAKLISRFSGIDKKWVFQMTVPLKESKRIKNSENFNFMNFKKTETIGSFKCTDTENEQEGLHMHTDFSKIRLPSVIKQNAAQQNIQSSRYEQDTKLKQYQAALELSKQELQAEKRAKQQMRKAYQQKMMGLNRKIELCHSEWETYKTYASSCIRKCKIFLSSLNSEMNDHQKVEQIFDQIFSLENKLQRKIIQSTVQDVQVKKQMKIAELLDIENEIKKRKQDLDKIQTQRVKIGAVVNTTMKTINVEQPELIKMLFIQAKAIENII